MFQVHGLVGQIYNTRAERLRRIERVPGTAATAAIEADEVVVSHPLGRPDDPGQPHDDPASHNPALQAYAAVQRDPQGTGARPHPRNRVADWMSQPVHRLSLAQSTADAQALLAAHRIAQAPVLEGDRLVGLALRQDLAAAPANAPLRDWLRSPVPAATPELSLRTLATALLNTGLPGVPVTDAAGRLVGFITRSDLLRAIATEPVLDLWG
jgi:CBS domain